MVPTATSENLLTGTMETEDVVGNPTLVRRVSDMPQDESNSGPPILFRHASMQKIRHCCQNLNLLPYLLYSFDNSKSHPLARKMHLCMSHLLQGITAKLFLLHKSFRHSLLREISPEELQETTEFQQTESSKDPTEACKPAKSFRPIRPRRKQNPLFLTMAVYFAPLLLIFQLIGLLGLMVFGKYTPGFIFLISALLFLGCISLKIFFHQSVTINRTKNVKSQ